MSQEQYTYQYGGYPSTGYPLAAPFPPQPPGYSYPQQQYPQPPQPPQPPQGPIYDEHAPQPILYANPESKNPSSTLITSDDKKGKNWKAKASALSSWRMGVLGCAITSLLVLLVNVILTVRAAKQYGDQGGLGTIFDGSCKTARRSGTYIHLGINALSTALLSCSNYCMQCLNAPTRKDVDRAHAKRRWVEIGVPKISNLRWVGWKKTILWGLLVLSSVPLHLLYNSAVFTNLISNEYNVYRIPVNQVEQFHKLLGKSASAFERIEKQECVSSYARQLVSDRRNVGVIISANSSAPPLTSLDDLDDTDAFTGFATNTARQPFDWICNSLGSPGCNEKSALEKLKSNGGVWRYRGSSVQYCLTERVPERCKLQFSQLIMRIVIVCNAVKLLCMVCLCLMGLFNKDDPLVTVGDAVSSFMETPDLTLSGMCLTSRDDVQLLWKKNKKGGYGAVSTTPPAAKQWKPRRMRWFRAAGWGAWIWTYIPALVLLAGVAVLLLLGLGNLNEHGVPISALPFGSVDVRAIISINYYNEYLDLASVAVIANIPQLVLSILYFQYNRLYTFMLLSYEYESYSLRRDKPRTLRVSRPIGLQRSNYFLSLPYRYSLPLMLGSLLLHWLFSQSLFLARVDVYNVDGSKDTQFSLTDCGYSPLAIILSGAVSLLLMVVGICFGFFRSYRGSIPFAGSNSAAISAACLRPHEDFDGHLREVTWGEFRETQTQPVGHCSFTSGATLPPTVGRYYA